MQQNNFKRDGAEQEPELESGRVSKRSHESSAKDYQRGSSNDKSAKERKITPPLAAASVANINNSFIKSKRGLHNGQRLARAIG
jgi:hypothetical protein